MAASKIATGLLPKLFKFGNRIINTTIIGSWIDALTGGNVGNLINKYVFGKTTGAENQNNLGLNNRLLDLKNTGTPTRGGALRFLGDGGSKLDDAPDIVPTNRSVLDSIAINQGLAIGNTMVPEIDNTSSTQSGFSGLREEVDKINRNIQAIATAMLTSASIESSYRQELLDDLEKSLTNKDKVRSQTRTERAILNTITKQKEKIVNKTGNLADEVANALALSLGLEVAGGLSGLIGGDKGDNNLSEDEIINNLLVGDPNKEKPEGFMRGLLGTLDFLTGDEYDFDNMGRFNFNMGESIQKKRESSDELKEKIDQSLKKNFSSKFPDNNNQWWDVFDVFPNKKDSTIESKEKENVSNLNQQEDNQDLSQNINTTFNKIAFSPLESMSGTTQIIDLRTAQQISGQSGTDIGGSSNVIDSEIADLNPERRSSPYEVLVRSV